VSKYKVIATITAATAGIVSMLLGWHFKLHDGWVMLIGFVVMFWTEIYIMGVPKVDEDSN